MRLELENEKLKMITEMNNNQNINSLLQELISTNKQLSVKIDNLEKTNKNIVERLNSMKTKTTTELNTPQIDIDGLDNAVQKEKKTHKQKFADTLVNLPNKIVSDDIVNFLDLKTDKHLFSDIYEGRTTLNPYRLLEKSPLDRINLYAGGWGHSFYIRVWYSIKENIYTYDAGEIGNFSVIFKSGNWIVFHEYVRKDLLDTFIHFNKPLRRYR
jgi:hypothetical protein